MPSVAFVVPSSIWCSICLCPCYVISDTEGFTQLRVSYAMPGTDRAYGATRDLLFLCVPDVFLTPFQVDAATLLRAMPSTDMANGAMLPGARDAMSGTEIASGAILLSGTGVANVAIFLRACYAMSGTDIAEQDAPLDLNSFPHFFLNREPQIQVPPCTQQGYEGYLAGL
eukprot:3936552-Rhodomonas_salina.2